MTNTLLKEENIYSTIRPYCYISKTFGLMSFSIVYDKKPTAGVSVKVTFLDWLHIIKTTTFCIAYVYLMDPVISNMQTENSLRLTKIQNIGGWIMYFCEIFLLNIVMINNLLGRNKILKFLQLLYEFDQYIEYIGFSTNHRKHKVLPWIFLGGSLLYIFSMISSLYYLNHVYEFYLEKYCNFATYIFLIFVCEGYLLILSQLAFAALAVKVRFTLLNKCFRHYFQTAEIMEETCEKKNYNLLRESIINHIAILHDLLNDAIDQLNVCFSIQTAGAFACSFVFNLFCVYDVILILADITDRHMSLAVIDLCWTFFLITITVLIIHICNATTKEGNYMKRLIGKAIPFIDDEAIVSRLNIFTQQLKHRPPIITSGLFPYNWTLLFCMIGATATYLIILIQFEITIHKIDNYNNDTMPFNH